MASLRITTKCATVDEFVSTFARHADETSLFVAMKQPRPLGEKQPLEVRLADGKPVLIGEGQIVESRGPSDGGERPGMRVALLSLDDASRAVHARLLAAKAELGRNGGARAGTQSDYAQVDETGAGILRVETGSTGSQPAIVVSAPSAPAPPLPAPPVLPPRPASSLLPSPSRTVLGIPAPILPASPAPRPTPPSMPPPIPAASSEPAPLFAPAPAPLVPLAEMRDKLPEAPPPAPVLPSSPATPPLGQPQRGKTGGTTGLETAWQASPPAIRDDEYAPEPDRRGRVIVGVAAGVGGLVLGLLLGYLAWHGKKPPPAAAAAPATPAPATPAPAPAPAPAAPAPAAPAPASATCTAQVHSTPPGVDVLLDDKPAGKTPIESLTIPCAGATISLVHPRYERIDRQVTATPDKPTIVDEHLARPDAVLELASSPPGATFAIDGKTVGKGPTKAKAEAFIGHTVTATLPGYKPWSQKVYLKGTAVKVSAKLEPAKKSPKIPFKPR
jgi:hypothetical protein